MYWMMTCQWTSKHCRILKSPCNDWKPGWHLVNTRHTTCVKVLLCHLRKLFLLHPTSASSKLVEQFVQNTNGFPRITQIFDMKYRDYIYYFLWILARKKSKATTKTKDTTRLKMDQYNDSDNSWWRRGRKNIIMRESFLATGAKSGSTPHMNDCAKQPRGCGAKIWLLENLAGAKKGRLCSRVGHKLPIRPNENSRPHIRGGFKQPSSARRLNHQDHHHHLSTQPGAAGPALVS